MVASFAPFAARADGEWGRQLAVRARSPAPRSSHFSTHQIRDFCRRARGQWAEAGLAMAPLERSRRPAPQARGTAKGGRGVSQLGGESRNPNMNSALGADFRFNQGAAALPQPCHSAASRGFHAPPPAQQPLVRPGRCIGREHSGQGRMSSADGASRSAKAQRAWRPARRMSTRVAPRIVRPRWIEIRPESLRPSRSFWAIARAPSAGLQGCSPSVRPGRPARASSRTAGQPARIGP